MHNSGTYSMAIDSRLNMEIGFVKNTFVAVDRTLYGRLIYDGEIQYPFLVLQRLIKEELDANKILEITKPISTKDPMILGKPYEYPDAEDGVYVYQKMIIPSQDAVGARTDNQMYFIDTETIIYIDDDGEEHRYNYSSDFDKIFDIINSESSPDNCFIFDDKAFTLYSLMKCYLSAEKDRINEYIRNGCKGDCVKSKCSYGKEDILLSSIIILKALLEQDEVDAANILLERLHNNCSGLCKDSNDLRNGCGCK